MSKRPGSEGSSVSGRTQAEVVSSWPERIRHHGARLLLLVALATLITVFFPPTEGLNIDVPSEGAVAQETVTAEIAFSVPKAPAELERDRRLAMETVPPTFRYRAEAGDSVAARLTRFFDRIDSVATAGDTIALGDLLRGSQITATPSQTTYLIDGATRAVFRTAAIRAANEVLPRGVVDPARILDLTTETVTVARGVDEESVRVDDVLTSGDFYAEAVRLLPPQLPPDARELFRLLLIFHLEYSLELDVFATEQDRGAARESVPLTKGDVLERQVIVRTGDLIGSETRERLDAYYGALRALGDGEQASLDLGALVGAGMLNCLLLSIFGLLVFFARPEVYANFRWLLLLAILAAAYFGAGIAIDRGGLPPEWLPIAFVALPVAVLWDTRMALLLVLVLAALTGTLEPFSDQGTVLGLMAGGAAAAMSVRAVRRRSETWVSIAIISGASALMLLAHGMATSRPLAEVAQGAAVFAGNATASALLAMGFLWVFEMFTGITTVQTLLEWADPTRPLLRRLAMEAPGTYAHSINVANLAEAAATRIDANGLLCRVGVLYHDVGKMLKPHYFVENQPDSRNPHDKLKPETSASIVLEHVTEGARLARDENVPDVVVQFIYEHHGTQRIGFFYEKAREEAESEVDVQRFTYPGPKPRSKETAIVMLADSCESATRAMHDPTPERVRDLIDTVVQGKIADGQLDEAPLTLGDVAQVKEQFVSILAGVHHRRIEYPGTKHLTDAEAEGDEKDEPAIGLAELA
ncbi:MAG: HDIG domain-containing protein [Gemmatimonadota bacterium]|nr:HDIG domain-containing protein [Gemmatimonadota bacterium]MDH3421444.1 HDIG domain-containing protein [Gemmatimonadota bacterium]